MTDQDRRKEFGRMLRAALAEGQGIQDLDAVNCYFQPGPNTTMQYPCIVYERDNASVKHADNTPYAFRQRYQVTHIDREPDSAVLSLLRQFQLSSFSRHFATSELNHDVFVIYH